jgi:hypothetical protein
MNEHRKKIEQAENSILDAYWDACDAKGGPILPSELTDSSEIEDYLGEAYDIATRREAMVKSGRAIDWEDSGSFF